MLSEKSLKNLGPSFIYIRRALSEYELLHVTHSGKCVYSSYLRAASVKDEYTNMESQSYFFLPFTFILMKGQAEFLCLLSISAASQQTTEQAAEELTNLFIKKKQNHFFSLSAEICEALGF